MKSGNRREEIKESLLHLSFFPQNPGRDPSQRALGISAAGSRLHSASRKRPDCFWQSGLYLMRQRPTLPHTFACSTIGPAGLNFRVRDGNGWIPRGKITDFLSSESLGSNSPATTSC